MAKFVKGQPRPANAGRVAGKPNKLTATVRSLIEHTLNELQDDPKANLLAWAKRNPGQFYQLASKLIPVEVRGDISGGITIQLITGVPRQGQVVDVEAEVIEGSDLI